MSAYRNDLRQHRIARRAVIAGAPLALGVISACGSEPDLKPAALVGEWGAIIDYGGASQRMVLELAEEDGGLSARVGTLDQSNGALFPASVARLRGNRLTVGIEGAFELNLTLISTGRLDGRISQGGPNAASADISFVRDPDFDAMLAAQPAPPELTDAFLEEVRAEMGVPALAAASLGRDAAMVQAVSGVRSSADEALATVDDVWHLGSIAKPMTATLIALLVEDGALSWETTVDEFLGELVPGMREEFRDVTFVHLLSHHSGVVRDAPWHRFASSEADTRAARLSAVAEALAQPPIAPKGAAFAYSNAGFVVAGAMVEARLGTPWESVIADRLFDPLGLESAGYGAPGTPGSLDQPLGHTLGPRELKGWRLPRRREPYAPDDPNATSPAVLAPAGNVHMTLADLLAFGAAHRDRASILSAANWRQLHTPPFASMRYGLGLFVQPSGALWHSGSNGRWYAELLIDPSRDVVAAVATNQQAPLGHLPTFARTLASAAEAAVDGN